MNAYDSKFEMTSEGYTAAVEYLKSIGKYDKYANSSENDGYSIVSAANYNYQKQQPLTSR